MLAVLAVRSAASAVLFAHVLLHRSDLDVAEHDREAVQDLGVQVVHVPVTHAVDVDDEALRRTGHKGRHFPSSRASQSLYGRCHPL